MDLFKKYGIKEIAEVTFYSVITTGNQEFYIPVLFLDTLKVSNLTQKSSNSNATGGYANQKILSWSSSKNLTLKLEDALFSSASQSLMSGWLNGKISPYISIFRKVSVANKYGEMNYSTCAYPSPEITDEEWELIFRLIGNPSAQLGSAAYDLWNTYNGSVNQTPRLMTKEYLDQPGIGKIRKTIKEKYYKRTYLQLNYFPDGTDCYIAFKTSLYTLLMENINRVSDYYKIDTNNYKINAIDRMERCVASEKGLIIDFNKQQENVKKYFKNIKDESYFIYFDSRTMQPLVNNSIEGTFDINTNSYFLPAGTVYYKWSRTVTRVLSDTDYLGETLIINADNFPQTFKIVGETYIREQQSQKDLKYQFVINRAQLSPDTNINLSAAGEPTTFSMDINILPYPNGNMIELRKFDVIEDKDYGGTKIVSRSDKYTRTHVAEETTDYDDIIVIEE